MSLNCNEIDLILDELNLSSSFIQEIVQPSFDSIALYTYKVSEPKTVFISLAQGECRINQVKRKIPKNEKPLRFNEILRSKIKGSRIISCTQLFKQRVIKIELFKEGPIFVMNAAKEKFASQKSEEQLSNDETFFLYIRLWSNAANIFLCDKDNLILDSFYRRPKKNEITGSIFTPPVQQNFTSAEEEKNFFIQLNKKFPPRTFDDFLTDFQKEKNLSYNEKVDLFYTQQSDSSSLNELLEQAQKWYFSHKTKQEAALARLEEKRSEFLNAEQYKHQGNLILTFAHLVKPNENYLECEDFENGKTVQIKIDPKITPQQNAKHYYEIFKKQTSGIEELENDIQSAKKSLEELNAKYKTLISEKNPVKLEQTLRKVQKPKQQEKSDRPGLIYNFKEWTILVGRDANENDELLRHYVRGNDMWFHTRDFAGGYIFVKNRPGKTIPLEIMIFAGNLAVHYSKARKNGQADLYYTQVKHLRRAKNGPKGLVLPTNEKNLFIKADNSVLRKLEE